MTVCRYPGESRDPTARRSLQYRHPGNGRESSTPHQLQCRHRSEGRHPPTRHPPSYRFILTSRAPTPSSWLRPEFLHTPPALIPFPSYITRSNTVIPAKAGIHLHSGSDHQLPAPGKSPQPAHRTILPHPPWVIDFASLIDTPPIACRDFFHANSPFFSQKLPLGMHNFYCVN